MCNNFILILWLPSWILDSQSSRLDYLKYLLNAQKAAISRQNLYYNPPEIAKLYRYYVLSYTKAIGNGKLVGKYQGEFDDLTKSLLDVDWGKLKPTESQNRIRKLEGDLKTMAARIAALQAVKARSPLPPADERELSQLEKDRKAVRAELLKHKEFSYFDH